MTRTEIYCGAVSEFVLLGFDQYIGSLKMTPTQARSLAMELQLAADEADYQVAPVHVPRVNTWQEKRRQRAKRSKACQR